MKSRSRPLSLNQRFLLILIAITLYHCSGKCAAAQVVSVFNNMDQGVHFWIKSETKPPRAWTKVFIGQGEHYPIRLESPDRFHVVVEDQRGVRYSGGYMALKAMIQNDPYAELELGGIKETRTATERYWSDRERRWKVRERNYRVRVAVTYTIYANGYQYGPVVGGESR